MMSAAAYQAAVADRFVKHIESEYQADRELADARRKRSRVAMSSRPVAPGIARRRKPCSVSE